MADHVRKQIRDAVKVLLTGLGTTGSNVFVNRLKVLQESELPALGIETGEEVIVTQDDSEDPILERQLAVDVGVYVKVIDDLDDDLDQVIKEVEEKAFESVANNTLNGLVQELMLVAIEVGRGGEGEQDVGVATMRFEATYSNQASAPDDSI